MTANRLWILGASDPEMAAIETLVRGCGEQVAYAACASPAVVRVGPGNASRATHLITTGDWPLSTTPVEAGDPGIGIVEGRLAAQVDCAQGTRRWAWISADELVLAECRVPATAGVAITIVDHHSAGGPGYSRPPADFMAASSLGQVLAVLARAGKLDCGRPIPVSSPGPTWPAAGEWMRTIVQPSPDGWEPSPPIAGLVPALVLGVRTEDEGWTAAYVPSADLVLAAAADHCLAAAYAEQCPGVDPEALGQWRAERRAAFQRRPVAEVLADVDRAQACLCAAPRTAHGVADCRTVPAPGGDCALCGLPVRATGDLNPDWPEYQTSGLCLGHSTIPELPEAAVRLGIPFIARVPPAGREARVKVVLQGAGEGTVAGRGPIEAFIRGEICPELVDRYGDPGRGFAGGYEP